MGFCSRCMDVGWDAYKDCSSAELVKRFRRHVRTNNHKIIPTECSICHKDLKRQEFLKKHYCQVALKEFEGQKSTQLKEAASNAETIRIARNLSTYDQFVMLSEQQMCVPGIYPLMAVPRHHKHIDFGKWGSRTANDTYKRILREKIERGLGNFIDIPKRITVVNETGRTEFLLSQNVLTPSSKKLLVEDVDNDTLRLSLKKVPNVAPKPSIGTQILDSLKKLKSYFDLSIKKGFNPHESVPKKLTSFAT